MIMAAAARWDQLPDDMVRCIHALVPCPIDGVHMALVCTSWRRATATEPARAAVQLPWLLLPPSDARSGPSFSSIMSDGARHIHDLPEDARRGRFFGSYEGRWLFVALRRTEGHVLLNLRTRERFPLPDVDSGDIWLDGQSADRKFVRGPPRPVVMLAATLSSAPAAVDDGGCVAAAILTIKPSKWRYVCFWRLGSRLAIDGGDEINSSCGTSLQDIAYFRGRFFVLTKGEHLRAYTVLNEPDPFRGGDLRVECSLYIAGRDKKILDGECRAGYLVESRCDLLMVVKEWVVDDDGAASCIQLFVLTSVAHDNPELTRVWTPVECLDGRLLVVGPGCSRAYERGVDFPAAGGISEGVYFLDDRTYYNTTYFVPYFNLHTNPDEFTCTDNGRCNLPPQLACPEQCFPRKPEEGFSSGYSSPCLAPTLIN